MPPNPVGNMLNMVCDFTNANLLAFRSGESGIEAGGKSHRSLLFVERDRLARSLGLT
jgi:hypothetical protein